MLQNFDNIIVFSEQGELVEELDRNFLLGVGLGELVEEKDR